MADDPNKVIFGAEFEGGGIAAGVDEIIGSLEKAEKAQQLLKIAAKETTEELKKTKKAMEENAKALKVALDPKTIETLTKKQQGLLETYDGLVDQQADLAVAYKKTTEVIKGFNKAQNDNAKDTDKVSKAVDKFTSVNELAADGVKKVGNFAKDAAFGIVSGFAGALLTWAIPALAEWALNLVGASNELTKLEKNQKTLNEVFAAAAKAVGDDVAKLDIFRRKLNDTNIPAAERVKIAKEYNKTAEETNKIDLKQIDNLQLINEKLEAQNKLILQRAISTAALAKLGEGATKFVDLQLQVQSQLGKTSEAAFLAQFKTAFAAREALGQAAEQNASLRRDLDKLDQQIKKQFGQTSILKIVQLRDLIVEKNKAEKELKELGDLLNPLITPEGITTKTPVKAEKTIENVFAQKLAELKARLADVSQRSLQSEGLIREKFEAQLEKEFFAIGKLLKEKKLTLPQADILKGLLKQINDVELSKGLEEFRKKVAEALRRVNDEINNLNIDAETKRINNLRDQFEKERQTIEQQFQTTITQIEARQAAFNKKIDDDTKLGLMSPQIAKRKKMIAFFLFGGLTDEAEQAKLNAQLDLAFKIFQDTLERGKKSFEDRILEDNQTTTKAIREQVGLYLEGKITYEKYQENLTNILKEESRERRRVQLEEAEFALDLINKQLAATTDPAQLKQLQAQRDALLAQISSLKREVATGAADDDKAEDKKRIDKLLAYVNAVNQLATAVLQFWQQVNQAEAQALDRSIALQNKRVENAREIADKGNAEYLEMEQKRLDELERKREANARRQLAINNALVASQAIVAAITAIAQAVQTGNPLAAIAAVAAVIGAIGAAYSFVNSLQPQDANFFTGTEFVNGPEGKDKVKANLTKGERVVTAKDNEQYWSTLSAIHNHTIPAEDLNRFVESYPNGGVPLVDFDRLSVATDGKLGYDSEELLNKVDNLNGTMKQVVVGLNELGINVNLDEHGFELAIAKARKTRLRKFRS